MTTSDTHDRNGDLTLREAELQLGAELAWRAGHLREHELLLAAHREKHDTELVAVTKAETAQQKAIDAALQAVERSDDAQKVIVTEALESHHREHIAHESSHAREHTLVSEALQKAEVSMDKRLEGLVLLFGERDKAYGERFDGLLETIRVIRESDVKSEGKALGQGTVVAIIVGTIGLVGTVLGIIVVLANAATAVS